MFDFLTVQQNILKATYQMLYGKNRARMAFDAETKY